MFPALPPACLMTVLWEANVCFVHQAVSGKLFTAAVLRQRKGFLSNVPVSLHQLIICFLIHERLLV